MQVHISENQAMWSPMNIVYLIPCTTLRASSERSVNMIKVTSLRVFKIFFLLAENRNGISLLAPRYQIQVLCRKKPS